MNETIAKMLATIEAQIAMYNAGDMPKYRAEMYILDTFPPEELEMVASFIASFDATLPQNSDQ